MVPEPTTQRSSIDANRFSKTLFLILLCIFTATIVIIVYIVIAAPPENTREEPVEEPEPEVIVEPPIEPEPPLPKQIDFQSVVEEWADSNRGTKSVYVYDLELNNVIGSYNAEANYNSASLYKLFVVYEGYRRINSGEWLPGDVAGSTGHTILECLDLAIRESHSPCAETLWGWIGHDELNEIAQKEYGILNSDISSLSVNAKDVAKMLEIYYKHDLITDSALVAQMKDSFLNQPVTIYDWRMGLPRGFSENVNVYNKVGWLYDGEKWNNYHDAAIIEFPEQNRHFVVVVMTYSMTPYQIRKLATAIENSFYEQFSN